MISHTTTIKPLPRSLFKLGSQFKHTISRLIPSTPPPLGSNWRSLSHPPSWMWPSPNRPQLLQYGESIEREPESLLYFPTSPRWLPKYPRSAFHIAVAEFLEEPAKAAPSTYRFKPSIVVACCSSFLSASRVMWQVFLLSSVGGRAVCKWAVISV